MASWARGRYKSRKGPDLRSEMVSSNGRKPLAVMKIVPPRYEDRESVLATLEEQNRVDVIGKGVMEKARFMYISQLKGKKQIVGELQIKFTTLEQWIVLFDWDKQREENMFLRWRKVNKDLKKAIPNIEERSDRIASTIESVIEEKLNEALNTDQDSVDMSVKDLQVLAKTLKEIHELRRLIHGRSDPAKRVTLNVDGEVDIMHRLGEMVVDATRLPEVDKRLKIEMHEDMEFEHGHSQIGQGLDSKVQERQNSGQTQVESQCEKTVGGDRGQQAQEG